MVVNVSVILVYWGLKESVLIAMLGELLEGICITHGQNGANESCGGEGIPHLECFGFLESKIRWNGFEAARGLV